MKRIFFIGIKFQTFKNFLRLASVSYLEAETISAVYAACV